MYGMINQGIKDLVVSKFGEASWESICNEAKVSTQFVSMQYYPDSITYSLVGAASKVLALPAETVLLEFGKHWVLYTATQGYGSLMDLFGKDLKSCLQNLNHLHARMGTTMPQLSPPRFIFSELDSKTYLVEYHTSRSGLDYLAKGLLEGLALKYKVKANVELLRDQEASVTKFKVHLLD